MARLTETPLTPPEEPAPDCAPHAARIRLLEGGDSIVEMIGELFLEERFRRSCPRPGFGAARLEQFTRTRFPRIMIDPECLDPRSLDVERLRRDIALLAGLVEADPRGFARLAGQLGDPEKFRRTAKKLGLEEEKFLAAGGGLIGWIIVIVGALVLSGCGDPTCGALHRLDRLGCLLKQGHTGKHRDRAGHNY
jgi:hypothetical protein